HFDRDTATSKLSRKRKSRSTRVVRPALSSFRQDRESGDLGSPLHAASPSAEARCGFHPAGARFQKCSFGSVAALQERLRTERSPRHPGARSRALVARAVGGLVRVCSSFGTRRRRTTATATATPPVPARLVPAGITRARAPIRTGAEFSLDHDGKGAILGRLRRPGARRFGASGLPLLPRRLPLPLLRRTRCFGRRPPSAAALRTGAIGAIPPAVPSAPASRLVP